MKFILFAVLAYTQFALAFLNSDQEKIVVTKLNEICAKTWCKANDSFSFQSIRCMKINRSCLVTLRVKDQKEEWEQVRQLRCAIDEVNTYADLMAQPSEAAWSPLNEEFYKAMTNCLNPYLVKPDSCKF